MNEDIKLQTRNNMQADNEPSKEEEEEVEHALIPGPSISNWRKVAPNSLTALANAVGLSAMMLGMRERFDIAVLCILGAGVLDGLDGPVARALGGTSRFGAEFDSLSDYVNFGVSPGVLLFYWSLQNMGWLGWGVTLTYIICMGCRLARFNAGVDFNASPVTRSFFMGVPAPAGAMLVVTPIGASFLFKDLPEVAALFQRPEYVIPYTIIVAFLLVSRVPTFSSKMVNRALIGKLNAIKLFLIGAVFAGFLYLFVFYPWLALVGTSTGYMLSFPVSWYVFTKWTAAERKQAASQKKSS